MPARPEWVAFAVMLFNSFQFAVFYVLVTAGYFLLPHRFRWGLLLAASCGFYMAFVPAYILILLLTILIDYFAGIRIEESQSAVARKWILYASIASTCLVLFVFKYFAFVNSNVGALARFVGWNYSVPMLEMVLPIGLSFHTFQSLSYVIEVYFGRQKAERHFGIYSLYVMFYPQLVAGPIERPQNLLHQFHRVQSFDPSDLVAGLKRMSWGLFKKLVVADRLAIYVNEVYGNPTFCNGTQLLVATVFFAYQIYCDFSGYSDIAIGAARTMGFRLMENFDRPYLATDTSEFWKRWHISLSTWFKDYVYFPLGGNRVAVPRRYFNLLVTFLISGIWHGANWTFVAWGLLNGIYLVVGAATRPARNALIRSLGFAVDGQPVRIWRMVCTFALISIGWVLFRAKDMNEAIYILTHMWDVTHFSQLRIGGATKLQVLFGFGSILALEIAQYLFANPGARSGFARLPAPARWAAYYAWTCLILVFGVYNESQFIYFQF